MHVCYVEIYSTYIFNLLYEIIHFIILFVTHDT